MVTREGGKYEGLAAAPAVSGSGAREGEEGVEAIKGLGTVAHALREIGVEKADGEGEHGAVEGRVGFGVRIV